MKFQKGFSLTEIVVVMAIFVLLVSIGSYVFVNMQRQTEINAISDNIVSQLHKAKSNAIAGKNNTNFGVKFNATSTVQFQGTSYVPSDTNNITLPISSNFTISNNLGNPDYAIIFARLTGIPQTIATINITDSRSGNYKSITIGEQGEISVIK